MATTATHKPTLEIEADAARIDIAKIAAYLQEHIGQQPTAYLGGLKDTKTVGQWAAGKVHPRDTASLRLRHAYHATRLLVESFGDETAKAWLFGTNSHLGDEAPAFVLRHARLPEEVTPIVRAARAFAEPGRREPSLQAAGASVRDQRLTDRIQQLERAQLDITRQLKDIINTLRGWEDERHKRATG